ncbi:zonular occludens toxin domain-containing protein [Lysobacter sp. FW306-1B-D06B]|uniref:zonular occludens toxin domain-containing protein n=1 Tax=Lysobacter sp. FW306-1B-D06B TaxID=3140250 RepID=UPI00314090A1
MIYWYTGQPGHGKTLHAIDHAIDFRNEGRLVYVCNVRGFEHEKARMLPMSPEQFRNWMDFLPDGAVAVVDEAYEHEMLPKRPAGSKVPAHVQQLAKHRHRGLDFIFVSQSPAKQVDEFVHDLIERHIHVRRRFGLPFAHLRVFDRFERNPEKGHPLHLKRVKLPKRPMGLYESTVMDTTDRKIPWYYPAAFVLLAAVVAGGVYAMSDVKDKLSGESHAVVAAPKAKAKEDGAGATADAAVAASPRALRDTDYVAWLTPRIGGQPWTAPAYDALEIPRNNPPRVFCMASGHDGHAGCSCLTEQGTRYVIEQNRCRLIATDGQYEPFIDTNRGNLQRMDEVSQRARLDTPHGGVGGPPPTDTPLSGATMSAPQVSGYGDIGAVRAEPAS